MPRSLPKKKHDNLYDEIQTSKFAVKKGNQPNVTKKLKKEINALPPRLSKKLLQEVQAQQKEIDEESDHNQEENEEIEQTEEQQTIKLPDVDDTLHEGKSKQALNVDEELKEIDPEDEAALAMFMIPGKKILNLGEEIMKKIQEKEDRKHLPPEEQLKSSMDPKMVRVYIQVGEILENYRSGKLPKAVRVISLLDNWEEVLYITKPAKWTPAATRELTKIFVSLKPEKVQRFHELVLLPKVRDDIAANKTLNVHLEAAIVRSFFKPAPFFLGFLLPLLESGTCTLLEAIIIASTIRKNKLPIIPASVALLKIAQLPYNGANSIFINTFINKRYGLPYRVVEGLVEHFLSFTTERRGLPVIWHRSLLSFAQRYKEELTAAQKESLKQLLKIQHHRLITPEIRRELFTTKCRDDPDTDMLDQ